VDLDVSQTKDKTVKDRKFVIDAALVRVMKARKTMKFEELIAAAIQQLTFFKAEIRDVRRAIEDLIGREYFERDSSSRDTLKYLA
jgi:cullin 1